MHYLQFKFWAIFKRFKDFNKIRISAKYGLFWLFSFCSCTIKSKKTSTRSFCPFWFFFFFLSYFQNIVTSLCVMSILRLLIVYWIQLPADNRLLKDNSSVYLFFIKERTIFWRWEFKVSFDLDNETARLNIKIVCKARIQIRKYSLLLKEF